MELKGWFPSPYWRGVRGEVKNQDYFDTNKSLWNGKTEIHVKSDFYDVESFKRGKSSLNEIELNALGDVKRKINSPSAMSFRTGYIIMGTARS